jgi:tripartite-type tricarboxylate transporter receptor subunit TctC
MIGTDIVAKSSPDGYTLLFTASGPLVINPVLYKKIPYDPVRDFTPVCLSTVYQYALVVTYESTIQSLSDLINTAKLKPNELTFGSTGIGGGGHLAGELLALMAGVRFTHIPYKGAAPALADVLANQLTFTFEPLVTAVPMIKANKLRAFAVSGMKRSKTLPNLATLNELGYSGFNVTQFQGLLAPAGTSPEIIKKLNSEMIRALKSPAVSRRLIDEGGHEIVASTPSDFGVRIQSDLSQYAKLINEAHINAE